MGGLALRVLDQSYSTLTNSLSLNHKYLQCFNAYVVMFLLLTSSPFPSFKSSAWNRGSLKTDNKFNIINRLGYLGCLSQTLLHLSGSICHHPQPRPQEWITCSTLRTQSLIYFNFNLFCCFNNPRRVCENASLPHTSTVPLMLIMFMEIASKKYIPSHKLKFERNTIHVK